MRSYKKERAEHVFVSESAATAAQKEQLQLWKSFAFSSFATFAFE